MKILDQLVAHRSGAFLVLATAAFFEAFGDSLFQTGLYRASGAARILSFAGGVKCAGALRSGCQLASLRLW